MSNAKASAASLEFFAGMIEKETGIRFSEGTFYQLESRLEDLAARFGYKEGIEELYSVVLNNRDPGLRKVLFEKATNNETYFFRDPKLYSALELKVLPELLKSFAEPIRIWSAASSSGQEAYSFKIVLDRLGVPAGSIDYLCSDINEAILARAEKGIYSQLEIQRGLGAMDLLKYFKKSESENTWEVQAELKKGMHFKKINLLDEWFHKKSFHLIFCRNVLIYQSIENRRKIMARLVDSLEPGGYLAMGAGESLVGISAEIEQIEENGAIIYRKKKK